MVRHAQFSVGPASPPGRGPTPVDAYVLQVGVGGEPLRSRDERLRCLGAALLVNPGESLPARSGGRTLEIRFSRTLVSDELASLMGHVADGPVLFDRSLDLRQSPTSGVARVVEDLVAGLASTQELMAHPAVQLRQVRTLVAACLLAQPHTFTSALVLGQSPPRPRTLRRAMTFVEDNLAESLSLGDLAAAAGCSARTLNSAFREHLGVTPMTYLRQLRLERVRDELLAGADPAGTRVSDVAYRWGFWHLGRFAGAYAQRFGELPSQTLARG